MNEAVYKLADIPHIICANTGEIKFFSREVKNSILLSSLDKKISEYIADDEHSQFLKFIDLQMNFADFSLKSMNPYKVAFAVKHDDFNMFFIKIYLFKSKSEMAKSGIMLSHTSDLYQSYIKRMHAQTASRLKTEIDELSQGEPNENPAKMDSFRSTLSDFMKFTSLNMSVQEITSAVQIYKKSYSLNKFMSILMPVVRKSVDDKIRINYLPAADAHIKIDSASFSTLTAEFIFILSELTSDGAVTVSATQSIDTIILDISTSSNALSAVSLGGSLLVAAELLPLFSMRLTMCSILADVAGYDIVYRSFIKSGSGENAPWTLNFSVKVAPDTPQSNSLKAPLILDGEDAFDNEIARCAENVFNNIIK
jgi:hypothetical protein